MALVLNIKIFLAVIGVLLILLVAVTRLHRPPTRPCHNCHHPVPIEERRCPNCGYRFASFYFSR